MPGGISAGWNAIAATSRMSSERLVPLRAELPVREIDAVFGNLQCMSGDAAALVDDLLHRANERGAPQSRHPRATGAVAVGDDIRVALDIPDLLEIEPQALGNQLLEDRLMTLAVGVRAHEHGRMALAVEADLAALVVTAGRLLDGVGDPEPQEPARCGRCRAPRLEPLGVDHRQGMVHVPLELAAIVVVRERCLEWHRRRRDYVAPAQFHPVDSHFAGGLLDDLLDQRRRLGTSGAAHRTRRAGVREYAGHTRMNCRRDIDAGHTAEIAQRRVRAEVGKVRSHTSDDVHAQSEETAVSVERELTAHDEIATLLFQNAIRSLVDPFDGTSELLGGP